MSLTPHEAMARLAAAAAIGSMTATELAATLKKAGQSLKVAWEAIEMAEREERVKRWQGIWIW